MNYHAARHSRVQNGQYKYLLLISEELQKIKTIWNFAIIINF